ncbi:14537_t:CDS:2 [Entrophospora sp. SA101]|nr:14537_t:CDS:2 [Entrophospora sp. SA101]
MLSTVNVGPRLLSIFNNGRFEQYLDAVPLTKDEIRDKEISRKIASSMFKLHEIPVPADIESAVPEVWSNIDKWYELSLSQDIVENSSIKRFNLESLKEEVEELKRILEMVNSPIIFGHNDVNFNSQFELAEWTSEDDSLLKIGVKNFGYENWEKIASTIPGRNEYQCKKRFDYILSSSHFINDHDDVVNRFNVKNILAEHHPTFFNADLGGLTDKMSQSQLDHDDSTTSSTERQQQHLNISLDCDDVVNRFNVKNILAEHHPTFFNADLGGLTDKMSQSQLDHDDSTTSSTERQQQHLNISLDWNKTVDTALLHSVAIQAQNVEKELLPFPTISTHTNPSLPNSPNIFNSSDRPYKCSTCELAFARNHDLKRHQKIHEKIGCPQTP